MRSAGYRNQGKGQPHTDGSHKDSVAVDADVMAMYGNRAQRRFAMKAIRRKQKQARKAA